MKIPKQIQSFFQASIQLNFKIFSQLKVFCQPYSYRQLRLDSRLDSRLHSAYLLVICLFIVNHNLFMQFIYLLIFTLRLLLSTKGIELSDLQLLYPEWDISEPKNYIDTNPGEKSPGSDVGTDNIPKSHVLAKSAQNSNGSWNTTSADSASQNSSGAWSETNSDSEDSSCLAQGHNRNTNPGDTLTVRDVLSRDQVEKITEDTIRITSIASELEDLCWREVILENRIMNMEEDIDPIMSDIMGEDRELINLRNQYASLQMEIRNRVRDIRQIEAGIQAVWPGYISPISKYPFEHNSSSWVNGLDG